MEVLLDHVVEVAHKVCTPLVTRANELKSKFKPLFLGYSKCHTIFNSNVVDEESADRLGGL